MKFLFDILFLIFLLNTVRTNGFIFEDRFTTGFQILAHREQSSETGTDHIKFVEQPLDHFDQKENRTWHMRYKEDLQFWKPNGPIYLILGTGKRLYYSYHVFLMFDIAKETNGALFGVEHRYYGESIPLNTSDSDYFIYLTSRQALADLANFIEKIKSKPMFRNSKVVVGGGFYAGNLATWLKLLHPDKVDVVVASSAPLLATKNFYQYYEKVGSDFKKYGSISCYNKISDQFSRYGKLLQSAQGIIQLKKENFICDDTDMTKLENQQTFFYEKMGKLAEIAQDLGPKTIHLNCLHKKSHKHIKEHRPKECKDYDFIRKMSNSKFNAWTYQICTEFGFFPTTAYSKNHPFTKFLPLDYFVKICTTLFGQKFDERRIDVSVSQTNKMYGGLHPNVTKVLFVNGLEDPWSELGILKDLSADAPALLIPDGAHCHDLYYYKGDPFQNKIKLVVKKWLNLE